MSFSSLNTFKTPSSANLDNFEPLDWKLMNYISTNEPISKDDILAKFKGDKTYLTRLNRLLNNDVLISNSKKLNDSYDGNITKTVNTYLINDFGKRLLADNKYLKKKTRNKLIIEWVRYGITTIIAIAAFIKSFFFVS